MRTPKENKQKLRARTPKSTAGTNNTQSCAKSGVDIRAVTNDRNYWSLLTRVFICFIFRFQSKYCESQTTTNIATNIAT